MRSFLILLFIITSVTTFSQTIAFYPSLTYNSFYDLRKIEGHFNKEYKSQVGYSFGFELKDIRIDSTLKVKVGINYQNDGGHFYTRDGGQGGSVYEDGKIVKDVLGLEFHPFCFSFANKIKLNLGVSMRILLKYNLEGVRNSWIMGSVDSPSKNVEIDLNDLDGFVKPISFGATSSIGYEFQIRRIVFEPRYSFYIGLSNEFDKLQANTKSMMHSLQLSIGLDGLFKK